MKTIGQTIKTARLKKGLNIVEAAERAGINRMALTRIENEQVAIIDLSYIEKIVNALGMDPFIVFSSANIKFDQISIENLIKGSRKLTFRGKEVDIDKFIQLMNDHIDAVSNE
ncbi:helix-turn-helix domain-containing protein [Anoxynatronum buryatiense]|uniref:Helix-turn-helix n=1 Tax=Anoxynatronum buryatiense TaxID=489973 RepID=A0AA46AKK8_9CLOT|nr:helix-turn-helix transcriptional regulator [Anoxynatronum buryatiense]SMP72067.1 Helix-turn-helix [Anoxynatronum buryatiense]